MKQKFITILILFVSLFFIAGIVYFSFFYSNLTKFDNQYKLKRNEIVTLIDQISNDINSSSDPTRLENQITELASVNDQLKTDLSTSKTNNTNEKQVIDLNQKFVSNVDDLGILLTKYKLMLNDDSQIDAFDLIDEINTKLEVINKSQTEIENFASSN